MSIHADRVRKLAAQIQIPQELLEEIACLSIHLDEAPLEVVAEALSELRTMNGVLCKDDNCRKAGADSVRQQVELKITAN